MEKTVEISIVFPAYNRRNEVLETIKRLSQNLSLPHEVIILDNSPEKNDYEFPENVRYIFTGKNLGAAARNIGIKESKAPFILMLDDDSHPEKGSIESALKKLNNAPPRTAGITGPIFRLDGGRENPPLLPTAFHGCGALFRAEVLKSFEYFYPWDFCFYGEEYWSTLLLYSRGLRLEYEPDFKVCHRMSSSGRDKSRIIYFISLNNRRTWKPFVPEPYLAKAEFDTNKRYELISSKEGVSDSFQKAAAENIEIKDAPYGRMNLKDFEDFSLLSSFAKILPALDKTKPVILCGAGKFPTLWADFLKSKGIHNVIISDFNTGPAGKQYGDYLIISPEEAFSARNIAECQYICGHSAMAESLAWAKLLASCPRKYVI